MLIYDYWIFIFTEKTCLSFLPQATKCLIGISKLHFKFKTSHFKHKIFWSEEGMGISSILDFCKMFEIVHYALKTAFYHVKWGVSDSVWFDLKCTMPYFIALGRLSFRYMLFVNKQSRWLKTNPKQSNNFFLPFCYLGEWGPDAPS